jgi:hypothetical protein
VVFYERHLCVPADPAPWFQTLDRIDALKPEILVAGHKSPNTPDDPRATQWMREYIADFGAPYPNSSAARRPRLPERELAAPSRTVMSFAVSFADAMYIIAP